MKKTELENYDLTVYEETLSNGLTVYVVPKEDAKGIQDNANKNKNKENKIILPDY